MTRVALLIEYAGKRFHGSQSQAGVRTVQQELERALAVFLREPVVAIFAGRTDTGVHAFGQVVHFNTQVEAEALDLWRFCWGVNGILPDDMSVTKAQIVPDDFHARFSAEERTYVYRLLNRPQRSSVLRDTYYFIPYRLNLDLMMEAAAMLRGRHDFTAFRSTNSDKSDPVIFVSRSEMLKIAEGQLEFWIAADHFVYNMVRIIVGTLVEIGLGKRSLDNLQYALSEGYRSSSGPTAPPWGLTLNAVQYPGKYKLFEQSSLDASCPGESS